MISFKIFKEQNEARGVYAFKIESPKRPGQYFINLIGNTFTIKDKLINMGFKFFAGNKTWSIPDFKFNDNIKSELESYGVDMSDLEIIKKPDEKPIESDKQTKTEEVIDKMQGSVEMLKKYADDKNTKKFLDQINSIIDKLAESTDVAATQELIVNFLKFQAKMYTYSFNNQMLIWIQTRGKATEVHAPERWKNYGRVVTKFDKPIYMLRPVNFKVKKSSENDSSYGTSEKEGDTIEKTITRFVAYKAYDISDTVPIPGHPSPYTSITRKDWSKDSNETQDEVENMINNLIEWIKSEKINVDYEEMSDEMGGYSAGGKIAINNTFKGINLLSVLVHETAHEVLHWLEKKRTKQGDMPPLSRQEKEIDAESTAFVVLNYFGFETKDAPNYLALWRAKGEDIKKRREDIQKASKMIIDGIKTKAKELASNFNDDVQEKTSKFERLIEALKG